MSVSSAAEAKQLTREEIIADFQKTLSGLEDICDTYSQRALDLQLVFVQLKNQSKQMKGSLDKQLLQQNDDQVEIKTAPQVASEAQKQ